MESDKPTYSAILSLEKEVPTTRAKPDVNVIEPRDGPTERTTVAGLPPNSHREQLLSVYDKELRKQRDAPVLDGAHLRPAPFCMVETTLLLQVPRAIKGGHTQQKAGEMEQATPQGNRGQNLQIRMEAGGH